MAIYQTVKNRLKKVQETSFAMQGSKECSDLQRLLHTRTSAYDIFPNYSIFIAIECLIENVKRRNVCLLMSFNSLIEYDIGVGYSDTNFKKWCREAKYEEFVFINMAEPISAVVPYR